MIRTPTNCTVTIKRDEAQVGSLTGIPCLILPARPNIVAMNGLAAGKAYEFLFRTLIPEVKEQCQIVRDDTGQSLRVIGVMHVDTPRAAHTEGIGDSSWEDDA